MGRHCLLAILLNLLSILGFSQESEKIDSLLQVLGEKPGVSTEVEIYLTLAEIYRSTSPDTALVCVKEALRVGNTLEAPLLLARTHNVGGNIYWAKSNYEYSLEHFLKAKTFFEQAGEAGAEGWRRNLKNIGYLYFLLNKEEAFFSYTNQALEESLEQRDTSVLAGCYHNLGVYYESKQLYDQALLNFLTSLELKEVRPSSKEHLANSIDAVAGVYNHIDEYDDALEYYEWALSIRQEIGNELAVALSYYNIGVILYRQQQFVEAENVYGEALGIAERVGNPFLSAYCYDAMGDLKVDQGHYDEGIEYINKSLDIREQIGDKVAYTHSLLNMSEAQYEAGNITEAIKYAKQFQQNIDFVNVDDQLEMEKLLTGIYKEQKDYEEAFFHQETAQTLSDSIFVRQKKQAIENISIQHEYELAEKENRVLLLGKENQIQVLKTQNKSISVILLAMGFICAIIFSTVIYRHNNHRKKVNRELARRNDELLRSYNELNIVNNSLQQFVFAASHSFKERLRSINVFSQIIAARVAQEKSEDKNLNQAVGFVKESVDGMHKTLDNLLQYSLLHEFAEECESVNMLALVKDIVSTKYANRGVEWKIEKDLPTIQGNKRLFTELFIHIFDNAIKFKRENKQLEIEVGVAEEKGQQVFYVVDNGIGVDEQYMKYIFEPFKRLSSSEKSGSGLGLAICYNIIKIYNGNIWTTRNIPQGLVVKFTLPECNK